ncbi:hypothetical protein DW973_15315 [Parabacteroides merdae]|nr:hypothetical protein DW973_15315 [Parabacteroides merdae]
MNKRHYEHTLPNIRGSLSNTYIQTAVPISDGCFLSPKTPSRFRTAVSMSKNTVLILGNYIPPFKSNFL